MLDVVVLTTTPYAQLKAGDDLSEYDTNVLNEDTLVVDALTRVGLSAARVAWDDPTFDWTSVKAIVIRTAWDYFHRYDEFAEWLRGVEEKGVRTMNSINTIQWNIDKHYLDELRDRGIRICKSTFIEKGVLAHYNTKMSALVEEHLPWDEYVVKPCISGAAKDTYRVSRGQVPEEVDALYEKLNTTEAFVVQPFQHRIITEGEISVMVFDGKVTHAVLKKAKEGEFRVQDDFGGSVAPYELGEEEISFALRCVNACSDLEGHPLLYARVDMFRDNDEHWALAELELIEPELWFRLNPSAADVLAQGVASRLSDTSSEKAEVVEEEKNSTVDEGKGNR